MIGVVLILVALAVAGPIGLFLVAGAWSGIVGWLLSADADERATDPDQLAS